MNLRACAVVAVALIPASFLVAQQSIKCESNNGRRNYCGTYPSNQVRLDRQISDSPCVQGRTWGVDRNGLWVDGGCRAYFMVRGGGPGFVAGGPGPGGPGQGGNGWWSPGPGDTWPPRGSWHGGNWGQGGACFYKNSGFGGDFFCLRRGEARDALPPGMGDQVSSIRTFGGAGVVIFEQKNFTGARQAINGEAPDLRRMPVAQRPGHSWNDRISSVRVR